MAELVRLQSKGGVVPSRHVRDELRGSQHAGARRQPLQTLSAWASTRARSLDLCDDTWRAVRITAEPTKPVDDVPIRFVRGKSMKPLPEPTRGGDITRLWTLVNVVDEHDRMLDAVVAGRRAIPLGPCLAGIIVGSAGTCKTTALRFLRGLIDPALPTTADCPWR